MKRNPFVFIVFVAVSLQVSAHCPNTFYENGTSIENSTPRRIKTITNPSFTSSNTNSLHIESVELSKKETVMLLSIYQLPNSWVRLNNTTILRGDQTGKTYRLRRVEGMPIDKEVYTPLTGYQEARLFFDPVSHRDTTVSFIEGSAEGHWKVENIRLLSEDTIGKLRVHLEGTVEDSYASCLTIQESGEIDRSKIVEHKIPVRNGRFSYDFFTDRIGHYELQIAHHWMMYGSCFPANFIAEPDAEVHVHFYAYDTQKIPEVKTIRGQENRIMEYQTGYFVNTFHPFLDILENYEDSINKLHFSYTPEFYANTERYTNTQNEAERDSLNDWIIRSYDTHKTPEQQAVDSINKAIYNLITQAQLRTFRMQPSFYGFSHIRRNFLAPSCMTEQERHQYEQLYHDIYASLYEGHPYHADIHMSLSAPKVGKPYIDYNVRSKDGKPVLISSLMNGKITLVDLWASWCGPCRRNSMSYIPIYEKFKSSGFHVIGIAREKSDTHWKQAIEKDKYPWLNLIEQNDEHLIWRRNGLNYSAGGTFLIDKDGTVLAINPSAEELERILKEKLCN